MLHDRRHELVGALARAALAGASPSYLTAQAADAIARETGLPRGVVDDALMSTRSHEAAPQDRAFVDSVAYVLALAASERRVNAELAQRSETLRALLETTPDVIVRLDRELRCLYVNPPGERLLGLNEPDWHGQPAQDLQVRDVHRAAFVLTLRNVLRSARERMVELSVPTPHGDREFEIRVVPELNSAGDVDAMLTVWRDVTQQVRAEAERARLYTEIVRGQAELRDLLSRVLDAHAYDLRVTAARAEADRLTGRQREILRLLAAGWSNREIATQLGLQTGTVKNHVATILTKLDVNDRIQAAVRAVDLGLVEPGTS
jgi:PAS domain S-box-containing protein